MLSRRQLLASAALAGSAAVLLPGVASADTTTPQGWLDWITAHRDDVSLVADDGAGHRLEHLPHVRRVLASSIKVVHLAAFTTAAVDRRINPDEQVRVGDWDAYHPYTGDGGAHQLALTYLGIPSDAYGIANDPETRVPLARIAETMILFSDNAAADYLRVRLGDPALHAAAARGGWPAPDLRSFSGELLLLIMPEYQPPQGCPAAVRRAAGDAIAQRFVRDLDFRKEVFARYPSMPSTTDAQWQWIRNAGKGSAADLFALHRSLATGRYLPATAREATCETLSVALATLTPAGAKDVLFKGGSYPRTLTAGLSVRWPDGRVATIALLLTGVSDVDARNAEQFIEALIGALATPAGFTGLARALAH
jgi:hypothetical protein